MRPEERELLATLPGPVHWDRLLFSAKESVYKAWYPLTEFTGRFLIRRDLVLTSVSVPGPA
jgi:4'-phosphopantetheinyl transferase EntD